jgi:hypothetical protein
MRTNHFGGACSVKALRALLAAMWLMSLHAAWSAPSSVFYVAPNGNDQWSGRSSTANAGRTDGPFASVERALQAVRQGRKATATTQLPEILIVGGGYYGLKAPLVLTPEDSGLVIAASGNEQPILSGGRKITGWKQLEREGKQLWVAEVPQVREGTWVFRELWINGRRAVRARHPNTGYLKVAAVMDPKSDWTKGQSKFRYHAGDLKPWKDINQGEVVVMNRWAESRLPLAAIDEPGGLVTFGKRSVFGLEEGDLYYVEGIFDALDSPGEWCLERASGLLYYFPRERDSLNSAVAFAPFLTQILRLEGHPDRNEYVDNITLRGITFSHTEWCLPEAFGTNKPNISPEPPSEVGGFGQAEVGVPGAVWGEGVHNSLFENCSFLDLGNYGLELSRGCASNRVVRCEFAELGAGGIKLGETVIRENASEQTRANEISGCRIHDGGKMFHSAIGIWIGQSPDNRITNNTIHDFYYTGISIGWTWGYGPALASNNLVAFNHVHHIGIKSDGDGPILSDMGGIYTLGKQPGTRVQNNLWHDIAGLRYGGWGIYFDEGSSGIVAVSNIVYRTTHGGFHQHYGETNSLRNNIFAFARDHQLQRTRVEPHVSFSFETNIVFFDSGVLLGGDWSKDKYDMDWNVYFDARARAQSEAMHFADATLDQWRRRGHDAHSVVADPMFTDARHDDFRFREGSPALKMGFLPIDVSSVGAK